MSPTEYKTAAIPLGKDDLNQFRSQLQTTIKDKIQSEVLLK